MVQPLDLTGQRFGILVALYVTKDDDGRRVWFCQCDCGKTTLALTGGLNAGQRTSCGCLQSPDLTGMKFTRLTVTSKSYMRKRRQYYNCVCECGKEVIVAGSKLSYGSTRSCGCLRSDTSKLINQRFRKSYGEASRNKVIGTYKNNAHNKGFIFKLTNSQIIELLEGNCYYCGTPPRTVTTAHKAYGEYVHNGIDRLDSNQGYIVENCVSCCTECNYRKSAQHHDDFVAWIRRVATNLGMIEVSDEGS